MPIIKDYIKGLYQCLEELSEQNIWGIADVIFNAYKDSKQVFIMGNGGSAATASHFARDLAVGTAIGGKPRLRATSLTDNVAFITAIANDIDYSSIFEQQLIGQLNEGDVVIGISASGNSANVLQAIEFARSNGAITVGVIGFGGGKLKELAHKYIVLSSRDYGQVEDIHLSLAHIISYLVRERIANGTRAVFLDRDGTMARDVHYCRCPEDLELFPGTAKAVKLLNEHGFKVIVVTNQSGIARGYFTEETLAKIHQKMEDELAKEGAFIDAIYYCPHHPDDGCDCRKPKPKLVLQAAREHNISLEHSFVVGDLQLDAELGRAIACKTVLIGEDDAADTDAVAPDLLEAVQRILKWEAA